jgi:murein DD-endopeptidase MepM/ murein hydrolase activator NlpD
VLNVKAAWDRAHATVLRVFPEHQIYFRTNGKVRFVTVSTRTQVAASAVAAVLSGWMLVASASFLWKTEELMSKDREIAAREQQLDLMRDRVQALSADVTDLKGDVRVMAAQLDQRHAFLQQVLNNRLAINGATARTISTEQRTALSRAEQALKQAPRDQAAVLDMYRKMSREQLAFAAQATRATDARYEQLNGLLRRMGLSADGLVSGSTAMGGPLVKASFERGAYSVLEPQYKDLYMSWTRLDLLQRAMLSIPAFIPARNFTFTSGFGVRYDPFSGSTAMHSGIDMAGPLGTPIMAAASGVVVKSGWLGGYGNFVEIDHGRGLTTRYGHLHTIGVREGARIEQGDVLGTMGSTGRSTGVHLHYEVRVNGQAVNPMPFLEAARDVLEVQRIVDSGAPIADPAG